MAKRQVAGLGKSKGRTAPAPPDPGDYLVEVTKAEDKDHDNGPGFGWFYRGTYQVLDGPEQQDGRDPTALKIYDNIFVMGEDHPSYDDWGQIGADTLADLQKAAGVKKKSDAFDPEEIFGKTFWVRIDHRTAEGQLDDEGNPRKFVEVKRYWPDEEE